jgi:hypothetical protein
MHEVLELGQKIAKYKKDGYESEITNAFVNMTSMVLTFNDGDL